MAINIKFKQQIPEEIPNVPQKAGETKGIVTILADKIEGKNGEEVSFRKAKGG